MSASRMPTRSPLRFSSIARSAVAEDLPTPPLPDPTAMTWAIWPLSIFCIMPPEAPPRRWGPPGGGLGADAAGALPSAISPSDGDLRI